MKNASGTITTGGTAQTVLALDEKRRYLFFQNISDTVMYVNFDAVATSTGNSIKVDAGGWLEYEQNIIPWTAMSVLCATTGKAFVLKYANGV